jgi:hypothetical protein
VSFFCNADVECPGLFSGYRRNDASVDLQQRWRIEPRANVSTSFHQSVDQMFVNPAEDFEREHLDLYSTRAFFASMTS